MKIQKHFVAYIDILGFGKYVKDNRETPDKPLELLQQFIDKAKMFNLTNKLNITAFSDNIVISMLAEEPIPPLSYALEYWNFINYLNTMQIYMITGIGILPIRGGYYIWRFISQKKRSFVRRSLGRCLQFGTYSCLLSSYCS